MFRRGSGAAPEQISGEVPAKQVPERSSGEVRSFSSFRSKVPERGSERLRSEVPETFRSWSEVLERFRSEVLKRFRRGSREVLERGSGKVPERGSGAGEKSHSFNMEEKCLGFPGAGESCVPAPGKLFPGAGKKSHSFTIEKNV